MVRINFKELNFETSIGEYELVDLRKDLGNLIFKNATDVPLFDLSREVFHAEGEISIDEGLFSQIIALLTEQKMPVGLIKNIENNAKYVQEDGHDA